MSKSKRLAKQQMKIYECKLKHYKNSLANYQEGTLVHKHIVERITWYNTRIHELKGVV